MRARRRRDNAEADHVHLPMRWGRAAVCVSGDVSAPTALGKQREVTKGGSGEGGARRGPERASHGGEQQS
ncbi:hypothetical protein Arub01_37890 [Actinomadura rubrobrunea]|uniref:Uncharacterized protein n=1 Tax=Actinomadura rubrobrunea TaxID=115335 RepID=A0A9W6PW70_9ACTN|nr:hypothetical protein Arub01_37890 [Actinomadura rubrobrunea]